MAERVARDPKLRAEADRHRAMSARLRGAFEPLTAEPVALPSAAVIDFSAARARRGERRWWHEATAIAATLVLGLVIGARFVGSQGSPVAVADNGLVAAAALEQSLDRHLAGAPQDGDHRIGLTFRDRSGRICRTFSSTASSGLACRDGSDWAIEALVGPSEGQSGEFRMAAGSNPRLATIVDEMIAGEPFDETREKAARDRGWSTP